MLEVIRVVSELVFIVGAVGVVWVIDKRINTLQDKLNWVGEKRVRFKGWDDELISAANGRSLSNEGRIEWQNAEIKELAQSIEGIRSELEGRTWVAWEFFYGGKVYYQGFEKNGTPIMGERDKAVLLTKEEVENICKNTNLVSMNQSETILKNLEEK